MRRIGVLASHPIQYQAPLFRDLARRSDLRVYFAHRQDAAGQARAGFGVEFEWDVDLLSGYESVFLRNTARHPGVSQFGGCDTPEIARVIREGAFDAFIVMGWYLKSYWQAVRACRSCGVPVLVRGDSQLSVEAPPWKRIAKAVVYPWFLRRFDGFLYVGERNRAYLTRYGVPGEKLHFSPHCVDNHWFASRLGETPRAAARAALGLPAESLVLLFVGRFVDKKRPLDVVLALERLRAQGLDAMGLFAGDGPLRAAVEALARERGVPARFLGFCNQSMLPGIYRASDLLVLPSDGTETWGLVVNEALVCGLRAIVSERVGCVPDLLSQSFAGRTFPMGDVGAMAEAARRTLGEPADAAALRALVDRYSVERAADGILGALDRVSGGQGARPR